MRITFKAQQLGDAIAACGPAITEEGRLGFLFLEATESGLDIVGTNNFRLVHAHIPLSSDPAVASASVPHDDLPTLVEFLSASGHEDVSLVMDSPEYLGWIRGKKRLMSDRGDLPAPPWREKLVASRGSLHSTTLVNRLYMGQSLRDLPSRLVWLEVPIDPEQPIVMRADTSEDDVIDVKAYLMPVRFPKETTEEAVADAPAPSGE